MAIDLPPAIPPQLTELEQVANYAAASQAYVGNVKGYEIQVTGDHYLSGEELDRIFATAQTPSQAILLMNSATLRKGNLLVVMRYAPDGNVVKVHALQATLSAVGGDQDIAPYFSGLVGDADLKRSEFDRARVTANVRSSRVGVDYSVSYNIDEANPGSVSMVFEGAPVEDHDATDLVLQLSNQGSRFVGRYFADAGVTHNFGNGTRLALGYETAMTDWGESRQGDDYHQYQLQLDHPFSFGLYGVDFSHIEYTQDYEATVTGGGEACIPLLNICFPTGGGTTTLAGQYDADIDRIGFNGEQILASDQNYRLNLFERIEYIDSLIEDTTFGSVAQDEKYGTIEVGAKYFRASRLGDRTLKWNIIGSAEAGVTGDDGTLGTGEQWRQDFEVANPGLVAPTVAPAYRTAEFLTLKPRASADLLLSDRSKLRAQFSAQIADEQLPQQQQWVLGGISQISAYLPGVLVGDTGYYSKGSFEYRFGSEDGFSLTASIFAEYGAAQFENASGSEGDMRSIIDAGIGLTALVGDTLEIKLAVAESIEEDNFTDEEYLAETEADFFASVKLVF